MTDLDRLGLALVGPAVAVVLGGVLLGLIGRLIKGGKWQGHEELQGVANPSTQPPRNPSLE